MKNRCLCHRPINLLLTLVLCVFVQQIAISQTRDTDCVNKYTITATDPYTGFQPLLVFLTNGIAQDNRTGA